MITSEQIVEMARSNAEMAVDQRGADMDTVAAFAQNVRDTLAEWGVAQPRLVGMSALHGAGAPTCKALGVYYARVAELLAQVPASSALTPTNNAPELTPEDVAANSHAYAGDHVAAARDRMDDARDYRAMLALAKWRAQWPGYPNLPSLMESWASKREPRSAAYNYILSTVK